MSTKERAIHNAVILAIGTAFELFLSYFFIILLAKHMGPAGLGQYYYIMTIVTTISLLYYFNAADGLMKNIAQNVPTVPADTGRYLIARACIAVICILAILIFSLVSSRSDDFKMALVISTLYAVSLIFGNLLENIPKAHQDVIPYAVSRVVERFLALLLLYIFLSYSTLGIIQTILVVTSAGLAQLLVLFLLSRSYLRVQFERSADKMWRIMQDGIPYFLGNVFTLAYYRTDIVMLGWLSSDESVGYYGAANQLYQIFFLSIGIFNAVIYPPLLALYKRSRVEFTAAVDDLIKHAIVYVVGLSFGLFVLAEKIVLFVFREPFAPSIWILQAFSIILLFSMFIPLFSSIFTSLNKQMTFSVIIGMTAFMNAVGNYLLIGRYSYSGAVYATGISVVFCYVLSIIFLKRSMRFSLQPVAMGKSLLAGLIMTVFLRFFFNLNPFLLAGLGLVIYGLGVVIFRYFSAEDLQFFKGMLVKGLRAGRFKMQS